MKVLTAAQMREVDRKTIEMGIPGIVLMENAGHRVVEFLVEAFAPIESQRVVILCGKGNNGGDGLVVARQLFTRFRLRSLDVVLLANPEEMKGDAAQNFRMLQVCGCPVTHEIRPAMQCATLVLDALLGTGITGPATGKMLEGIRAINQGFLAAKVVALDIPSGMPSDTGSLNGEMARADYTVTFTAPKVAQALAPNCDRAGILRVEPIGSPPFLYEEDALIFLSRVQPAMFEALLAPRARDSNKGRYGHVLVIGGSPGKTGAAAMSGMSALRAGAGLVTVASDAAAIPVIAAHAAELMTEALFKEPIEQLARNKSVVAIGPGMGTAPETTAFVRDTVARLEQPMVIDADGLNALVSSAYHAGDRYRVMTPHPGEMSRLIGSTVAEVQADRVGVARRYAMVRNVVLVLKGQRTLIAFPDGRVWINPTGSPAMATGGTGDILTGLIAGFLGQFPQQPDLAVAAAVYLHGLAGELGAAELGEQALVATDLLRFFPRAVEECVRNPYRI